LNQLIELESDPADSKPKEKAQLLKSADSMTVKQLQAGLKRKGLDTTGLKSVLITRLKESLQATSSNKEEQLTTTQTQNNNDDDEQNDEQNGIEMKEQTWSVEKKSPRKRRKLALR